MRILHEKSTCNSNYEACSNGHGTCDENCETCSSLEECSKDKCEHHGARCKKRVCPKMLALLRLAKTEEERNRIRSKINKMMENDK